VQLGRQPVLLGEPLPRRPALGILEKEGPSRILIRSPGLMVRDRLGLSSLTSTFPPSTASAAWDLVLKKRAAQSHLSRRAGDSGSMGVRCEM
jgi:hypothetical protein